MSLKFESAKAKTDAGDVEYQRIVVDPEDADVDLQELLTFFQSNSIPVGYEKVSRGRVKEDETRGTPGLINFALRGYNQKVYTDTVLANKAPEDPVVKMAEKLWGKGEGLFSQIPAFANCTSAEEIEARMRKDAAA
jgi:hypothetical protein